MKNYILILLMIAIILVSGCSAKEEKREETDQKQDEIIEQQPAIDEEEITDAGKHKVNFYLFYSSSCSHCHSEREWISTIKDEYPYVNFIMYEVSEYSDLFDKVTKSFDSENEYVPVTVIGNNYMIGYSEAKNRKFIRYIEELSTFESCDVVQTIIDGGDVDSCMKQNEK